MKALVAAIAFCAPIALVTSAVADPTFSTGGPCTSDATSRVPAGARQVLLNNPSKLVLAAILYRQIDKPNFKYIDADGTEQVSEFPYHYHVFIPPNGSGPVGCTKMFVADGEATQTFVLQKTDYLLAVPGDATEEARRFVGFIGGVGAADVNVINLHPAKTIHVMIDRRDGSPMRLDLPPQAVSTIRAVSSATPGHRQNPRLTDVHF